MKTKLDQISIPPLCRSMSEMVLCVFVAVSTYLTTYPSTKAVSCNWKVLGSNPSGVTLQDHGQVQGCRGRFFFAFFCFDFPCIL